MHAEAITRRNEQGPVAIATRAQNYALALVSAMVFFVVPRTPNVMLLTQMSIFTDAVSTEGLI